MAHPRAAPRALGPDLVADLVSEVSGSESHSADSERSPMSAIEPEQSATARMIAALPSNLVPVDYIILLGPEVYSFFI